MNQSGGLQRLAGVLVCDFCRCQLAQLVIYERQQLLSSLAVALFDLR